MHFNIHIQVQHYASEDKDLKLLPSDITLPVTSTKSNSNTM